jgi:hypothetical protein
MFSIIERSFKFSDNGFGFKIPKICLIKKTCPRKQGAGGAALRLISATLNDQRSVTEEQGENNKFLTPNS